MVSEWIPQPSSRSVQKPETRDTNLRCIPDVILSTHFVFLDSVHSCYSEGAGLNRCYPDVWRASRKKINLLTYFLPLNKLRENRLTDPTFSASSWKPNCEWKILSPCELSVWLRHSLSVESRFLLPVSVFLGLLRRGSQYQCLQACWAFSTDNVTILQTMFGVIHIVYVGSVKQENIRASIKLERSKGTAESFAIFFKAITLAVSRCLRGESGTFTPSTLSALEKTLTVA